MFARLILALSLIVAVSGARAAGAQDGLAAAVFAEAMGLFSDAAKAGSDDDATAAYRAGVAKLAALAADYPESALATEIASGNGAERLYVLNIKLTIAVPSGSMKPTLANGAKVVAVPYPEGAGPQPGHLVVLERARDPATVQVKRVVAGPGDQVQMTDGLLTVNGRAATQAAEGPFTSEGITYRQIRETLANGYSFATLDQGSDGILDDMKTMQVPPGRYFVLGDNRDVSNDSRMPTSRGGLGFVAAASIIGRAVVP